MPRLVGLEPTQCFPGNLVFIQFLNLTRTAPLVVLSVYRFSAVFPLCLVPGLSVQMNCLPAYSRGIFLAVLFRVQLPHRYTAPFPFFSWF